MNRFFLFLFIAFTSQVSAQIDRKLTCANITQSAWKAFVDAKYEYVFSLFSQDMKRQLSPEQLRDTWSSLELQVGKYKSSGTVSIEENDPYTLCEMPLEFENMPMLLKINMDSQYRIAGFFIVPGGQQYEPAKYINTLSFVEHKIKFGKAPFEMDGMLSVPKANAKSPVVIILGGSGPTDKDGTSGSNKPYKDLAWGLSTKGIATFRFDKRTNRHGVTLFGSTYLKTFTPEQEYVEDALMIIDILAKHPKIDASRIYLLGHSQGGMMAPLIAQKSGKLKGIILMSANARSIQELMIEQLDYLYSKEGPDDDGKKAMAAMLKSQARYAMRKDLHKDAPSDSLPNGTPASYWIYLNAYKPAETLKMLKKERLLILQGARDYQVGMRDFNLWKQATTGNPNATTISYPDLNHQMIRGSGTPGPDEYRVKANVDERVIQDVSDWILKVPTR